jgi:predicted flap endonuclease-1-like 5' DNA nuclease
MGDQHMNETTRNATPADAAAPTGDRKRLFGLGLGVVAASTLAGGLAGYAAVKGLLLVKGASAAQLAMGAKTAAQTAGLAPVAATTVATATGSTAAPATTATVGGWSGKLAGALKWLGGNAAPLGAGAVGGGAAGLGLAGSKVSKLRGQLQDFAAKTETLSAETARFASSLGDLAGLREQVQDQAAKLSAVEAGLDELKAKRASEPESTTDRLEDIHGIGEVYAERLRAAGVHTFGQLAAESVERVRDIVGRGSHLTNENIKAWIEEAATLAG